MYFCPNCGCLLLVESDTGSLRFFCSCCPYVAEVMQPVSQKVKLPHKEVEDVLGGSEAWKDCPQTEITCPYCENNRAYYMQIQIRSADEPMTSFYKCTKCDKTWNDNN
ncbi:hypothetical protein WA158_007270 [Blastocystis sp. Blastoise]